jgi:hypothetical protein
LRRELYQDLQEQYLADPKSGKCPFFNDGQEFMLENEDFFRILNGKFCIDNYILILLNALIYRCENSCKWWSLPKSFEIAM